MSYTSLYVLDLRGVHNSLCSYAYAETIECKLNLSDPCIIREHASIFLTLAITREDSTQHIMPADLNMQITQLGGGVKWAVAGRQPARADNPRGPDPAHGGPRPNPARVRVKARPALGLLKAAYGPPGPARKTQRL